MNDLFTVEWKAAIHKATNSEIIIRTTKWYKGEIDYECLVPMKDGKGKLELCSATYNESEVLIIN